MTTATQIQLARAPETDDELWHVIYALWGVKIPRVQVCTDHVAPFTAVAHAFFAREPGYAVWYASRGSGKSLNLAVLGLTKSMVLDVNTTILGGSMTQSQNVAAHMSDYLEFERAPLYALKGGEKKKAVTATQISLATGKWIRPIPASQTTVRGPHPPLQLLDEVDEMDLAIYDASLGQAMEQRNIHGTVIGEYIVASSTWQNPDGTFTEVMDRARKRGQPIFTWCWRELIKTKDNPDGWMSQQFIDRKRQNVSAEMWRTEYELNEPSAASRAFDLDALERNFVIYPDPVDQMISEDDSFWEWESPVPNGVYYIGADWAKERDKTVFSVIRTDVTPRRVVYLRRMNRKSYKIMVQDFDKVVRRYHVAGGRHDKTGLGNAVADFSTVVDDGLVAGFDFTDRKKRSEMLLRYIGHVEGDYYRLPRPNKITGATPEADALREFYKGHRATTTEDVYGNYSQTKGHLPDDVSSMALAHMAAGDVPEFVTIQGVAKQGTAFREATAQFDRGVSGEDSEGFAYVSSVGVVTVDREIWQDISAGSGTAEELFSDQQVWDPGEV